MAAGQPEAARWAFNLALLAALSRAYIANGRRATAQVEQSGPGLRPGGRSQGHRIRAQGLKDKDFPERDVAVTLRRQLEPRNAVPDDRRDPGRDPVAE